MSSFLSLLRCQFPTFLLPNPNYGQILPLQDWSCLTDMTSFCDKMAGSVNEGRAGHVIYLSLRKVFNTLSQTTLVSKFRCYCRDEQMKTGWVASPRGEQLMGPTSPAGQEQLQWCRGLGPDLVCSCQGPDRSNGAHRRCAGDTKLQGPVNTVTRTRLRAARIWWQKPCETQKAQVERVAPGIK